MSTGEEKAKEKILKMSEGQAKLTTVDQSEAKHGHGRKMARID